MQGISNSQTIVFSQKKVCSFSEGVSKHRHIFGGDSHVVSGLRVHKLYEIDFSDPGVPGVSGLEGRVQLYYCFDFRENTIAYFPNTPWVLYLDHSDPHKSRTEEYPYTNYPFGFPVLEVKPIHVQYNPRKLEDALSYAGVFGIKDLLPRDYNKTLKIAREAYRYMFGEKPKDDEEALKSFSSPMLQESPGCTCINPSCPQYGSSELIVPLCVVPNNPLRDVLLFGEHLEVQVVFALCRECGILIASNQAS